MPSFSQNQVDFSIPNPPWFTGLNMGSVTVAGGGCPA